MNTATTLAQQTIQRAKEAIGVHEDRSLGENRGKWIDLYEKFLGIAMGQPWCACFVIYKIWQAAKDLGVKTVWPRLAWAASCTRLYNWASKSGLLLSNPVPGCVFIVKDQREPGKFRHIGFVQDVGVGTFTTIEGNSNENGSAEGYKVAVNVRSCDPHKYVWVKIA